MSLAPTNNQLAQQQLLILSFKHNKFVFQMYIICSILPAPLRAPTLIIYTRAVLDFRESENAERRAKINLLKCTVLVDEQKFCRLE